MWAGFAVTRALQTEQQEAPLDTAPVELTAVQPGPWLYRGSTAPP